MPVGVEVYLCDAWTAASTSSAALQEALGRQVKLLRLGVDLVDLARG